MCASSFPSLSAVFAASLSACRRTSFDKTWTCISSGLSWSSSASGSASAGVGVGLGFEYWHCFSCTGTECFPASSGQLINIVVANPASPRATVCLVPQLLTHLLTAEPTRSEEAFRSSGFLLGNFACLALSWTNWCVVPRRATLASPAAHQDLDLALRLHPRLIY